MSVVPLKKSADLGTRMMPLSFVREVHSVRPLNEKHVERIKKSMDDVGVQPFPLRVTPEGILFAGAHRHAALKARGDAEALIHVEMPPSLDAAALADNAASEQALPMTFVDHAELIWRKVDAGQKLQDIGDELGWSKSQAGNYAALRQIDDDSWEVVSTTLRAIGDTQDDVGVSAASTTVDFTEGLLRELLPLTVSARLKSSALGKVTDDEVKLAEALSDEFSEEEGSRILRLREIMADACRQQLGLVQDLASGEIDKKRFKLRAGRFRNRNAAIEWFIEANREIEDKALLEDGRMRLDRGDFDDDWKDGEPGPKLTKLVEALVAAWREKASVRLIKGDFNEVVSTIADGSIAAVITDPPYNISTDRIYRLAAQADWDKNFGEWDRKSEADFTADLERWAMQFFRVMKPGATGFMFVGEAYLNIAQAAFDAAGFQIKGTFFWCRSNPGTSVTKADFMPAMDFAIQFMKPGAARTFNYPGEPDGFNWRQFGICGGNERLKDSKDKTLHPTQKPEKVIEHLMEMITYPGDLVLDAFMGVGTTPAVARRLKRKCIGIEMDPIYFAAAKKRIED